MELELTAATQRALVAAQNWSPGPLLEGPALLLGLLSEPECRAAILLEAHGVGAATIQEHWPEVGATSTCSETETEEMVPRFSHEVETAVAIAREWLADLPHPLVLATEHLLMGLAATDCEVGIWLQGRQIDAMALRNEILRQYGLTSSELDIEPMDSETIPFPGQGANLQSTASEEVAVPDCGCQGEFGASESNLDDPNVVRLMDASANRAREALRVIEDYVRFVLDDRQLTEQLKGLRHKLTSALAAVSMSDRLAVRDTQCDVGTTVSTRSEFVRQDAGEVLTANFTRLQESLRSLEEFGKIGGSGSPEVIEQIRYQAYTLQKAVHGTAEGLSRLGSARLYVLVDGRSSMEEFESLVRSLVDAGVDVLQLRDKTLGDRELVDRARKMREVTESSGTLFVMNDRPDLAALSGADGVHVGQEELSVRDVRQVVGPRMLVGVSTHDMTQARRAVLDGASYLGVGPTFPSNTKTFSEFPGLEFAASVASEIRLPAFAIGGIGLENLNDVLATGIGRVAVSGAVVSAESPESAVRGFLNRLKADGQ